MEFNFWYELFQFIMLVLGFWIYGYNQRQRGRREAYEEFNKFIDKLDNGIIELEDAVHELINES